MIFAIDSGGTKTKILLADLSGIVMDSRVIKGFGIANDPKDEPIPELTETLNEMNADGNEITDIIVNLGGKNVDQFENCIRSDFPKAYVRVFRESSGVIGDFIRKKAGADIIFFSGTGCIALAKDKNGCLVLDGWGRDMGDLGSGYYIGLTAIQHSLLELEGQEPLSLLARSITGEKEPFLTFRDYDEVMQKRDEIRSRIMPLDRSKVADLTKTVFECARQNDKTALKIFETVGKVFAETVNRAAKHLQKRDSLSVAFCGGIVNTKEFWLQTFMEKTNEMQLICETVFPETDFAVAALEYAIEERRERV